MHAPIVCTGAFRPRQALTRLSAGLLPVLMLGALVSPAHGAAAQQSAAADPRILRLAQQAESDLRHQKPDLAAAEYQQILALDPKNLGAHSNLGLADYLQGKFAPAADEFEIALALKPDLWKIAALCGLSESRTGKNADATVHLDQAFEHVDEPSLRLSAGRQLFTLLLQAGQLVRAASVVDRLEQLDPDDVDVLYAAHQVYSMLADKAFVSMAELEPGSARMFELRADRMAEIGNIEGAIQAYRLAIQRDPHLSGVHFALGEALSVSHNEAERAAAEGEYEKALEDNPLDEKAECRLGDIAMQQTDLKRAAQRYQRALALQPGDADANEGYGLVLLSSDSARDARAYLLRAVQLDPSNVTAYYHLSEASRKTGDMDDARTEMEEFLKLKTARDALKHSFDDLPLQTVRQGSGRGDGEASPQVVPGPPSPAPNKNP
jgi:tetratricopeptide (TPR) repeat protein